MNLELGTFQVFSFFERDNDLNFVYFRLFLCSAGQIRKVFRNVGHFHYIAGPATKKCKSVAVLQLSSTLMTGQTRTNSRDQLSSKFEPVRSR